MNVNIKGVAIIVGIAIVATVTVLMIIELRKAKRGGYNGQDATNGENGINGTNGTKGATGLQTGDNCWCSIYVKFCLSSVGSKPIKRNLERIISFLSNII